MLSPLKCTAVLLLLTSMSASADEPAGDSIKIEGDLVKAQAWNVAQMKSDLARDIKTVEYKSHDMTHTATAAPLLALIKASGLEFDPKIKHEEMRCVVVVEGSDGYMASFALAEMWPDVGNREVWLALDRDGKPLEARDLPTSLIVPGDKTPARAVFGVKSIRVVNAGTLVGGEGGK